MTWPVLTTPEADAQIRTIDEWWRINRAVAPDLFLKELAAAFDLIGHAPYVGKLYRPSPITRTRRLLLKGSCYHVYYVPRSKDVLVLAIWHGQRGSGPPLRM